MDFKNRLFYKNLNLIACLRKLVWYAREMPLLKLVSFLGWTVFCNFFRSLLVLLLVSRPVFRVHSFILKKRKIWNDAFFIHCYVFWVVCCFGLGVRDAKSDWEFSHSLRIDFATSGERDEQTSTSFQPRIDPLAHGREHTATEVSIWRGFYNTFLSDSLLRPTGMHYWMAIPRLPTPLKTKEMTRMLYSRAWPRASLQSALGSMD